MPTVEDRIELVVDEKRQSGNFSMATGVSMVVHAALIFLLIRAYQPITNPSPAAPMVRYVELIKQNPPQFVEAPGPRVGSAPITAPYSDANRRASMPQPTGEKPTTRPGDGTGLYNPPMGRSAGPAAARETPAVSQQAQQSAPGQEAANQQPQPGAGESLTRMPAYRSDASILSSGEVNWRSAIKEVGKVASLGGGGQGLDLGSLGGEKGYAEAGPLSFETQWYDWGEYAQSMVSRIRVNWHNQMPQLIRTGLKGVVTIRFTIQRDGRLVDVTTLSGSGAPPYDFAARKAIELSSPLNPLPKDFPNPFERVTVMFFYNSTPPDR